MLSICRTIKNLLTLFLELVSLFYVHNDLHEGFPISLSFQGGVRFVWRKSSLIVKRLAWFFRFLSWPKEQYNKVWKSNLGPPCIESVLKVMYSNMLSSGKCMRQCNSTMRLHVYNCALLYALFKIIQYLSNIYNQAISL